MIKGAHFLLFSKNFEADRAFFRDVLGFEAVDSGGGWLIFSLPPAELAVHPGGASEQHAGHAMMGAALYLMCPDLPAFMEKLAAQNVVCSPVTKAEWGITTTIRLPSGGEVGLYQPTHPTAIAWDTAA